MDYKMLVLDIDGTVANNKKEITKRTKEAVTRLEKAGVQIVIASGRPTYGIIPVARELEIERYGGYILAYNGGRIMQCSTKEVIYEKILPYHFAGKIEKMAKELDCAMMSYEGNCVITTSPTDPFINFEAKINKLPIKPIKRFSDYDEKKMNKCIITAEPEDLEKVEPEFAKAFPELNVFRSEPFFLEIVPKGIDKALSLSVLLEKLGIAREEMVAMGDGFNDISMIRYAGCGVAMGNAQEAVKEVADQITLTNEEDGVAYMIDRLWR